MILGYDGSAASETPDSPPAALRLRGLSFSYGGQQVLSDIDLSFHAGEVCCLLGNNGAGKSTLLKCLLGALPVRRNTVHVCGTDVVDLSGPELARMVAYVPQDTRHVSHLTVFDSILMGRRPYIDWALRPEDAMAVARVIEQLGLEDLAFRFVDELSGGERQKVSLARALAQAPRIVLLDEPTSNLDLRNQLEAMTILCDLAQRERMAVVIAMHDINLAMRFADRFVLLRDGRVLASGGQEVMTPANVFRTYGVDVEVVHGHGRQLIVPVAWGHDGPSAVHHHACAENLESVDAPGSWR